MWILIVPKFILSSSEKAKTTFLVCLNHRSSETKSSTHCYYLENDLELKVACPGFWPEI